MANSSATGLADVQRWLADRGVICSAVPLLTGTLTLEPVIRLFGSAEIANCTIGAYSYVGPKSILHEAVVGRYCSIGSRCEIGPTQHPSDWLTTSPIAYKDVFGAGVSYKPNEQHNELSPVSIGNDVWIGSNVAIMGGVTIGDGAIIGFGSVVTRDVEPYSIVGGVPARMIRPRFDAVIINALMETPWFQYDLVHMRGSAIEWRKPLQALADLKRKAIAGEVDFIPSTLNRIVRTSEVEFSYQRM